MQKKFLKLFENFLSPSKDDLQKVVFAWTYKVLKKNPSEGGGGGGGEGGGGQGGHPGAGLGPADGVRVEGAGDVNYISLQIAVVAT